MKSLMLKPIDQVNGIIELPGSKSISSRALLLAALAKGTTVITNLLSSDDSGYMLSALRELGTCYQLSKDCTCCKVIGNEGILTSRASLKLFLGNSGVAMRLLTAVLCLGNRDIILTGSTRMKERPIGQLVDALRQGNAQISYLNKKNYPPLHLHGRFTGGNLIIDGSISSQFLSALLIAAPLAPKKTVITIKNDLVSKPYIDMTIDLMKDFGVLVENQAYQNFTIYGNQKYKSPGHYLIEGDASSASYFLAAAAIRGGTVKVMGVGRNSIQGDTHFANVLDNMGANITWGEDFISCTRGTLNAIDIDMNCMPDAAMTMATTALFAKGITTLRNIYNWRLKETDRLSAMSTELRKVGAIVEEGKDFIRIDPPITLRSATINTYNDHRIAMCFSLVALSDTPTIILNPRCIKKTFPDFFKKLTSISKIK